MFLFLVTYVFSLLVLVWVEFCIFSCNFFIKLYTFFIYVYECMFSPYMYLHLLTYIYLHTSLLPVSVLSFKYFSRYFYWGSRLKCENYAFYWTPHLLLFFFWQTDDNNNREKITASSFYRWRVPLLANIIVKRSCVTLGQRWNSERCSRWMCGERAKIR